MLSEHTKDRDKEHAAGLYREGRVTVGKAAEEARVPVREMLEYLYQQKVPMQYDQDDFAADLRGIRERATRASKVAEQPAPYTPEQP